MKPIYLSALVICLLNLPVQAMESTESASEKEQAQEQSGQRPIAFSPLIGAEFFAAVTDSKGNVIVFRVDKNNGKLTKVSTVPAEQPQ